MKFLVGLGMGAMMAVWVWGGWGEWTDWYAARAAGQEQRVKTEREIHCRAKLANWLMRHEELVKPEKERYASWQAYMGPSCVK